MALLKLIYSYLTNATKGFFTLLQAIEAQVLTPWANRLDVDVSVLLVVCCLLSAVVGFTAYKLIKLYVPLFSAFFGYYAGRSLFYALELEKLPDWSAYLFGIGAAILLALLTYRRTTYVWFVGVAALGYALVRFYLVDDFWVALGGAALLAICSMYALRVFVSLITGTVCATLFTTFLFSLLPEVVVLERNLFELRLTNLLFWAAVAALSALFVSVQLAITRRKKRVR